MVLCPAKRNDHMEITTLILLILKCIRSIYVTRHEKIGLMYTKYTYSYVLWYISPLWLRIVKICKLHEMPYEMLHK